MSSHDPSVRGIGGMLVGAGMALIAHHIGMTEWKVLAVYVLVSVGLPACVGGKWKNW
jgi:hypothetical protein